VPASRAFDTGWTERAAWTAAAILAAAYAVAGSAPAGALPAVRFGLDGLRPSGPFAPALVAGACVLGVALARPRARAALAAIDRLASRPAGRLALAAVAVIVFWMARTAHVNPDGLAFQAKFERAVPVAGVFATYDEILEFVVHSRAWAWAHAWWGWDVAAVYRVLSVAAGGVFVWLLIGYARLVAPRRAAVFTAVVCAGGFVQLFCGDVENYTLTAAWVMAYWLASERYLQGRASILWPTVTLALAMMFHLLAGFLVPSLGYLWTIAWRRGEARAVARASLAAAVVFATTAALCEWRWHLPLSAFWTSHAAGNGGRYATVLSSPAGAHLWAQLNVILLLCPAVVLAAPLAFASRAARTTVGLPAGAAGARRRQLAIASAFMLLFVFVWTPALGPLEDWNLFAAAAIPLSLLLWTEAGAALQAVPRLRTPVAIVASLAALHTLAWIGNNNGAFGR
jgi:hypothetical protein